MVYHCVIFEVIGLRFQYFRYSLKVKLMYEYSNFLPDSTRFRIRNQINILYSDWRGVACSVVL
jgi:hypothetical protein